MGLWTKFGSQVASARKSGDAAMSSYGRRGKTVPPAGLPPDAVPKHASLQHCRFYESPDSRWGKQVILVAGIKRIGGILNAQPPHLFALKRNDR